MQDGGLMGEIPESNVPAQQPPRGVAGPEEMYCSTCGSVIKKAAVICPSCGVPVKRVSISTGGKSKMTAVLLAIFLGAWTWVYTYREDGIKFWTAVGIGVVGVILNVASGVPIGAIPALGVWVWAIVLTASRNTQWYARY